jgi:hypothetical protein
MFMGELMSARNRDDHPKDVVDMEVVSYRNQVLRNLGNLSLRPLGNLSLQPLGDLSLQNLGDILLQNLRDLTLQNVIVWSK